MQDRRPEREKEDWRSHQSGERGIGYICSLHVGSWRFCTTNDDLQVQTELSWCSTRVCFLVPGKVLDIKCRFC